MFADARRDDIVVDASDVSFRSAQLSINGAVSAHWGVDCGLALQPTFLGMCLRQDHLQDRTGPCKSTGRDPPPHPWLQLPRRPATALPVCLQYRCDRRHREGILPREFTTAVLSLVPIGCISQPIPPLRPDWGIRVSPDGSSFFGAQAEGPPVIVPVASGQPRALNELGPDDLPVAWTSDRRAILIVRQSYNQMSAVIVRFDLATGRMETVRQIDIADKSGVRGLTAS
jgi:hypothetical protein